MERTSITNHFYKMRKDIGMADYEKQVKQEFYTPFLYLCFVVAIDAAEQSSFIEGTLSMERTINIKNHLYKNEERYRDGRS